MSVAAPAPGEPTQIGPYTVIGRLGQGGMGAVYLGQASDGPRVAVKVLHDEIADDPGLRERFRREAAAAGRVAGFSTAQVVDADLDGPVPYIASEYVDGVDLHEAVAAGGPLPPSTLEALAVGMASALVAIHSAGVVHRDLKPSNVLLAETGPRVIDFGIARATDFAVGLTATRTQPGTPAFMAPEQHKGASATPAADVFAWGAAVAFAGTGRLPFGLGSNATVSYRVVYGEPDLDGLPDRLQGVVRSALAKDPAVRPSARDLLLHLTGDPAAVQRAATSRPAPAWSAGGRGRSARRRRRAAVVAGAVLGVLALVGGAVAAWPERERPGPGPSVAGPTGPRAGPPAATAPPGPVQRVRARPLPRHRPPADLATIGPILRDDFTATGNGWTEERLDESLGDYETGRIDGAFRIHTSNETRSPDSGPSLDAWFAALDRREDPDAGLDEDPRGSRIHLGVDVARRGGDADGAFSLRCDEPLADLAYRFQVSMDGTWTVGRELPGDPDDVTIKPLKVLATGRAEPLVADAWNRLEAGCGFGRDETKVALTLRVNGVKVTGLSDPIPAPRDDKRFVASVSAFTPGSTPERPAWFDALIDNYTVWYDDARVLPAG